ALVEQVPDDRLYLGPGLAGTVDILELSLSQPAVVVDAGKPEVGEGQLLERVEAFLDAHVAPRDAREEERQAALVGRRARRGGACVDRGAARLDPAANGRQREGPPRRCRYTSRPSNRQNRRREPPRRRARDAPPGGRV